MTAKDLKRLTRTDLLEMLIEQSKQLKVLEERLAKAESALESREIHISEAGSIADAAIRIHGVFETAQSAADVYLENVETLIREQERQQKQSKADFEVWRERERLKTERFCADTEAEVKQKCEQMLERAALDTQRYWDEIVRRLEPLYEEFPGLKDRIADSISGKR